MCTRIKEGVSEGKVVLRKGPVLGGMGCVSKNTLMRFENIHSVCSQVSSYNAYIILKCSNISGKNNIN